MGLLLGGAQLGAASTALASDAAVDGVLLASLQAASAKKKTHKARCAREDDHAPVSCDKVTA